jgi:hypothetical protein
MGPDPQHPGRSLEQIGSKRTSIGETLLIVHHEARRSLLICSFVTEFSGVDDEIFLNVTGSGHGTVNYLRCCRLFINPLISSHPFPKIRDRAVMYVSRFRALLYNVNLYQFIMEDRKWKLIEVAPSLRKEKYRIRTMNALALDVKPGGLPTVEAFDKGQTQEVGVATLWLSRTHLIENTLSV